MWISKFRNGKGMKQKYSQNWGMGTRRGMNKTIPRIWEREWKKAILKIWEHEKFHSRSSGTGMRGFHFQEWLGTGFAAHTWPFHDWIVNMGRKSAYISASTIITCCNCLLKWRCVPSPKHGTRPPCQKRTTTPCFYWSVQKKRICNTSWFGLTQFHATFKKCQNIQTNAAYSDFKGRLWVPRTAPGIGRSMPRLSSRQIGESDASSCWCWSCCRPNATGDQSQKKHVSRVSRNRCLPSSFANRVVMVFVMGRPICKQIYCWTKLEPFLTFQMPEQFKIHSLITMPIPMSMSCTYTLAMSTIEISLRVRVSGGAGPFRVWPKKAKERTGTFKNNSDTS